MIWKRRKSAKTAAPDLSDPVNAMLRQAGAALGASRYADAQRLAGESLAIARRQSPVSATAVAISYAMLMRALGAFGKREEAISLSHVALQSINGIPPSNLGCAEVSLALGEILVGNSQYAEALPHLHVAGQLFLKAEGGAGKSVAGALFLMAVAHRGLGNATEAEQRLRQVNNILAGADVGSRMNLRATLMLCKIHVDAGRIAEARKTMMAVLNSLGQVRGAYPINREIGMVFFSLGEHREALEWLGKAIGELTERIDETLHRELSRMLSPFGISLLKLERYAEAEQAFNRQLHYERSREPVDGKMLGIAMNNVAVALREQGRLDEAEKLQSEALATQEAAVGNDDPILANTLKNLGIISRRQGREADANHFLHRALSIASQKLPPNHRLMEEIRGFLEGADAQ